jgi:hypothetical protein
VHMSLYLGQFAKTMVVIHESNGEKKHGQYYPNHVLHFTYK